MAITPIIQIQQLAPNQNQPDVTVNSAFQTVENATQQYTTVDFAGASSKTLLTALYLWNVFINITNTGTAPVLLTPQSKRLFVIQNSGSATLTVHCVTGGGASASVPAGAAQLLYCNGVDTIAIGGSGGGGGGISSIAGLTASTISLSDLVGAGVAPLASPALTGNPTAPTQSSSDNSTRVATTAYVTSAVSAVIAGGGGAPLASPTFTGDPRAPTPSPGDNDTSIATTAFVTTATSTLAPIASPTFTGIPKAPTPTAGDNDTSIATTAFVTTATSALAPIASPALTGNPTAPTQSSSDNSTRLATTAYVTTAVSAAISGAGAAPIASPTFTGDPKAPTPSPGDNDTSIATTAFVTAALSAASITLSQLPSSMQSIPLTFPYVGQAMSSQKVHVPIAQALTVPANFANTQGYAATTATSSAAFTVAYLHGGSWTTIGTITFGVGASTVTLSTQAAVNLVAGDVLRITAPSSVDGSLADFAITIFCTRV